jgi:ABC-2 type transport system permease protein
MTSELFLFKTAFKDGLKLPLFLATLLPAGIALLWKMQPEDRFDINQVYNTILAYLVYGLLLTLFALLQGTGVIAREVEQRTIVFLLTRPVSRIKIVFSRFLGAWLAVSLYACLCAVFLAIATHGTHFWKDSPLLLDLRILPIGAMVYCALFTLLGAAIRKPLLLGLLYVGWEQVTRFLPSGFSLISVMAYLRNLAPHLNEIAGAVKDPTGENESSGMSFLFGGGGTFAIASVWAWLILGAMTALALALAFYVVQHRAYLPKEESA